jgi:hypothetical protein
MKISKTLALCFVLIVLAGCEPPPTETQPVSAPTISAPKPATNEPGTNVSKPGNPSSPIVPR